MIPKTVMMEVSAKRFFSNPTALWCYAAGEFSAEDNI